MQQPKVPEQLTPATFADWREEDYLSAVAISDSAVTEGWHHHPVIENSAIDHVDFTALQAERFEASDVIFTNCDFANVDLSASAFYRVRFECCRLVGVNLAGCYARDVQFVGCQMDLAWLPEATLKTVAFESCRLNQADIGDARQAQMTFMDCQIDGLGLRHTRLNGLDLRTCDFTTIEVDAEQLRGVQVTSAQALALAARHLGVIIGD